MHTETPVPLDIREHQRITDEIERQRGEHASAFLLWYGVVRRTLADAGDSVTLWLACAVIISQVPLIWVDDRRTDGAATRSGFSSRCVGACGRNSRR